MNLINCAVLICRLIVFRLCQAGFLFMLNVLLDKTALLAWREHQRDATSGERAKIVFMFYKSRTVGVCCEGGRAGRREMRLF